MDSNILPTPIRLTCRVSRFGRETHSESPRGNTACLKSAESANCKAATEVRGRMAYMRIKPDWLNDSSAAFEVATAESSYIRRIGTPARPAFSCVAVSQSRCNRDKRTKERKSYPTVCRACCYISKRRLPKSGCRKAMSIGSEYPTWQRSHHSSPSVGKPRTWRRVAGGCLLLTVEDVRDV